jgi:hypothetical protein
LTNADGIKIRSSTIPATNEWYEVEMAYSSASETVDLAILRADGSTFLKEKGVSMPIDTEFDQLFIGETGGGPSYGSEAQVRLDDIKISKSE